MHDPEASWVTRNLLEGMTSEALETGGIRVRAEGAALVRVARFVVGLGDAAECETRELGAEVRRLAKGALGEEREVRAKRVGQRR